MTWRHVFDAKHESLRNLDQVAQLAFKCGYKFFAFNGDIYFLDSAGNIYKTGLEVKDVQ